MREIVGSKRADWIVADAYDDVTVYGRGGADDIAGSALGDMIYGGRGDDFLAGGAGNDVLLGGNGNDTIYGDYYLLDEIPPPFPAGTPSYEQIRGGNGDDTIYGGAGWIVAVGGRGDDTIEGAGGQLFGDEAPGEPQVAAGNDLLVTRMHFAGWTPTEMTGGRGADTFWVTADQFDGIASRVDVRDFTAEDRIAFDGNAPDGTFLSGQSMFAAFDTNGDRVLDGTDATSPVGVTWADPFANALCMQLFDGDMVALWGTQSLSDWQMV